MPQPAWQAGRHSLPVLRPSWSLSSGKGKGFPDARHGAELMTSSSYCVYLRPQGEVLAPPLYKRENRGAIRVDLDPRCLSEPRARVFSLLLNVI